MTRTLCGDTGVTKKEGEQAWSPLWRGLEVGTQGHQDRRTGDRDVS